MTEPRRHPTGRHSDISPELQSRLDAAVKRGICPPAAVAVGPSATGANPLYKPPPVADSSAAPTVTGDTATGDVRPLVCPYCAARIMPVHEYVGRDRGGEVFDGYECGNIRCDARWDKNGTPTGPPLSATGRGVGVTGDTDTATCPKCGHGWHSETTECGYMDDIRACFCPGAPAADVTLREQAIVVAGAAMSDAANLGHSVDCTPFAAVAVDALAAAGLLTPRADRG